MQLMWFRRVVSSGSSCVRLAVRVVLRSLLGRAATVGSPTAESVAVGRDGGGVACTPPDGST